MRNPSNEALMALLGRQPMPGLARTPTAAQAVAGVVGSTSGIGDRYDPRVGVATDAVPGTLYVDDWVKDMLTKPRRNNVQQPISRLRIHDLRHTHAAWLLSDGVPVFVVQRRLGHSSSATTENVYGFPLLVMELS